MQNSPKINELITEVDIDALKNLIEIKQKYFEDKNVKFKI